jgi:hypothetical protein
LAYCSTSDIQKDFKSLVIDDNSAIKSGAMNDLIEQESNYIDARIGVKYVTPVVEETYPEAFSLLKRICIFRVSDRVRNIIEVKKDQTQKGSDEKYKENKVRTPNDDLDMIAKGTLILKNVPQLSSGAGVSSACFDTGTCDSDCTTFDTSKQQW